MYKYSKILWVAALLLAAGTSGQAQGHREDIYAESVLYQKRVALEKDLRERVIAHNMTLPLDSNTEDKFLSACNAISQFLFYSPEAAKGFKTLFDGYDSLSYDMRRALLEAVYAVTGSRYQDTVRAVLERESNPKLFAMCAVYLYRADTGIESSNLLKIKMVEKFPGYDTVPLLRELEKYLTYHEMEKHDKTPELSTLFDYAKKKGQKVIYSFQRWNRDYPGLAIVQDENGHFVRNAEGRVQVFQQLARSGSDLPYFITDGSTPQGVYSIQGIGVSGTPFIGPTPNLQLLMPFEGTWEQYFLPEAGDSAGAEDGAGGHTGSSAGKGDGGPAGSAGGKGSVGNGEAGDGAGGDSLQQYRALMPPDWREYAPMMEAWSAGRIGRTEIIAHGTTIDPEYFKDKPFYPLTPTMGCLCAKELWNPTSGHLLVSEQYGLVSAFMATPGRTGYLYVINLDDQRKPVSRAEVESQVQRWEAKLGR